MGRHVESADDPGVVRKLSEATVDALVNALGKAQAELLRLKSSLTVEEMNSIFGRELAPAALTA